MHGARHDGGSQPSGDRLRPGKRSEEMSRSRAAVSPAHCVDV